MALTEDGGEPRIEIASELLGLGNPGPTLRSLGDPVLSYGVAELRRHVDGSAGRAVELLQADGTDDAKAAGAGSGVGGA